MRIVPIVLFLTSALSGAVQLSERTHSAYESYLSQLEAQMDKPVAGSVAEARQRALQGEIVAMPFAYHTSGRGASVTVPDGLINHWVGIMFIPNTNVDKIQAVLQDYSQYNKLYAPEVTQSSILKSSGDEFDVFLRLHRQVKVKALLGYAFPVEFNTNYHVRYYKTGDTLQVRSFSSKIAEVKDPRKSHTEEYEVGNDDGYLWRLRSYWRVTPANGGAFVECEAISLSRSVPGFVEKMVTYFTSNFPEDSMRNTLKSTKDAVVARQ